MNDTEDRPRWLMWLWLLTFAALVVLANVMTNELGLWHAAPGLLVTAGTYAAGFTFAVRDELHEFGWGPMVAAIAVGAVCSWWLTDPALAVASVAAFTLSEVIDALVYEPLREHGRRRALFVSNVFGAAADTGLFLALAGPVIGPFSMQVYWGQILVKVGYCTLGYLLLRELVRRLQAPRAVPAAG